MPGLEPNFPPSPSLRSFAWPPSSSTWDIIEVGPTLAAFCCKLTAWHTNIHTFRDHSTGYAEQEWAGGGSSARTTPRIPRTVHQIMGLYDDWRRPQVLLIIRQAGSQWPPMYVSSAWFPPRHTLSTHTVDTHRFHSFELPCTGVDDAQGP